jgi:hypothetical protein
MSTNATVEPFFVKKCSLEKFNLLDGIPNANGGLAVHLPLWVRVQRDDEGVF